MGATRLAVNGGEVAFDMVEKVPAQALQYVDLAGYRGGKEMPWPTPSTRPIRVNEFYFS